MEHAQRALKEFRFPVIKGQTCRALPYNLQSSFMGTVAHPSKLDAKSAAAEKKQIFVKNCPKSWTHQDLHKCFQDCGEIVSAKISINAEFQSRGYGFVEFTSAEAARKAVATLDGKEVKPDLEDEKAAPSEKTGQEDSSSDNEPKILSVSHFEAKRQRLKTGVE